MSGKEFRSMLEIVGVIGLIASLLLLTYEIRQTRLAVKGDTYHTRALGGSEADLAYANSPYLPNLDLKYDSQGIEALTPEERLRLYADANSAKVRFDAAYYQYELGLVDEDYFENIWRPGVSNWRKRWIDFDLLDEGKVRPTFREAVLTSGNDDSFVEDAIQ